VTTILTISGSLQGASSNSLLVRLAGAVAPVGVRVEPYDGLGHLPFFNPDLDVTPAPPEVAELRRRIGAAVGVLIASPEYAHEMPGVLKNALDWLVSSGELYGKPVALLCAAPSRERGHYAREALARTLGAQGARVVLSESVAVQRGVEPGAEVLATVRSALTTLREYSVTGAAQSAPTS
jgi:NAD(P)H-dependent FMN reductase